jgi:phenylpropionate dioxygenase-like ring-hydroxylating dioxygenase large terminal subunit
MQNDLGLNPAHVAAVRQPLAQASPLPPAVYSDPAIFRLERERIFARAWLPVCHVSQLPEPGSHVARSLVGEPVMALRGREGEIRVLSNVCLHRNTTLLQGAGTCKGNRVVCPYHGWTYGLDGKLLAAPFMDQAEGFDRGALRLKEFRSEIWQGFVFVNFDDDAPALAAQVGELAAELAAYRMADAEVVELRRRTMPWNWKISLENFSEAYHQPWVHPTTADHAFPARLAEYADVSGPYGLFHLFQPGRDVVRTFFPPDAGMPDRLLRSVTVFNVYPYLHALTDPSTPLWLDFDIKNENEHELIWSVMVPGGSRSTPDFEEKMNAFRTFIEPILQEDVAICTGVGQGVRSRFVKPGRLSHMEKTVHQFHNWWLDRMLVPPRAAGTAS